MTRWENMPLDVRDEIGAKKARARTLARNPADREALLDRIEAEYGHKERTRVELLFAKRDWTEREIKRQEAAKRRAEIEGSEREQAMAYAENSGKGKTLTRPGVGQIVAVR
jgi:hypothetical protein